MTKIVAFAGRKQSGKTTCSEFVANYYTGSSIRYGSAKIYNFADPLKRDICMNILDMTYEQCYGSDDGKNTLTECFWNSKQLTAREVMQFVGTDIFRTMKGDVWASATLHKIQHDKPDLAIVADCRFPNEVETIQSVGGLVIKLIRNPYNSDHASETALDVSNYPMDKFDLVVENDNMTITEQNKFIYNFLIRKGILPL